MKYGQLPANKAIIMDSFIGKKLHIFQKEILVPWDPLGRIFSKCVFLNLLNPLGLPIPINAMVASKKLNFFQGTVTKNKLG